MTMVSMENKLSRSQQALLEFLRNGGLVAVAWYGKSTMTLEVKTLPFCMDAGLKTIEDLRKNGLIRDGDKSPYKNGVITPVILTDVRQGVSLDS